MANKAQHTPGPWEYVAKLTASENHRGFFIRAEKDNKAGKWALAEVQPGDSDGDLGEANARLIAAAPDLLEVAEMVLGMATNYMPQELIDAAGIAAAKATGRSA